MFSTECCQKRACNTTSHSSDQRQTRDQLRSRVFVGVERTRLIAAVPMSSFDDWLDAATSGTVRRRRDRFRNSRLDGPHAASNGVHQQTRRSPLSIEGLDMFSSEESEDAHLSDDSERLSEYAQAGSSDEDSDWDDALADDVAGRDNRGRGLAVPRRKTGWCWKLETVVLWLFAIVFVAAAVYGALQHNFFPKYFPRDHAVNQFRKNYGRAIRRTFPFAKYGYVMFANRNPKNFVFTGFHVLPSQVCVSTVVSDDDDDLCDSVDACAARRLAKRRVSPRGGQVCAHIGAAADNIALLRDFEDVHRRGQVDGKASQARRTGKSVLHGAFEIVTCAVASTSHACHPLDPCLCAPQLTNLFWYHAFTNQALCEQYFLSDRFSEADKTSVIYFEHRTVRLPLDVSTPEDPWPAWPYVVKREFRECVFDASKPPSEAFTVKLRKDLEIPGSCRHVTCVNGIAVYANTCVH
mgnify:CR=1 FL=1